MIRFKCPKCGERYDVADKFGGRRARCKACGGELVVPAARAEVMKHSPRDRRLMADQRQLAAAFARGPIRVVESEGTPPARYVVEFDVETQLTPANRGRGHRVEVVLPPDYPRLPPRVGMLTPVFHPNIDESTVCVGDHWAAGERLADLLVRVGEMLAYQAYNIRSPLNGDAARWADEHEGELPIDSIDLRQLTDAL